MPEPKFTKVLLGSQKKVIFNTSFFAVVFAHYLKSLSLSVAPNRVAGTAEAHLVIRRSG